MKRTTLSIITGICLFAMGQANAHSGHHSHQSAGVHDRIVIRPANAVVDLSVRIPATGVYVNVLPRAHTIEVIDNTRYFVAGSRYYQKRGNRFIAVDSPHKKLKNAKHSGYRKPSVNDRTKIIVVSESR